MRLLALTLKTPEENLALDEALLNDAECAALGGIETHDQFETLRIWESPAPVVVVGSSTRVAEEVKLDVCSADRVPVLRRVSGGTTIVAGPGCLMYAVVLSYKHRPALRSIDQAHNFVLNAIVGALNRHRGAIEPSPSGRGQGEGAGDLDRTPQSTPTLSQGEREYVIRAGTSDLAIGDRKFSGNALRCRRHFMLYHGTLLYNFPLALISKYQCQPERQPKYRQQRNHDDFVTNVSRRSDEIRAALVDAFDAREPLKNIPHDWVQRLVAEKYTQAEWNNRL